MEVQARAKHLRMSARKVRLVVDLIRGRSAVSALDQLRFLPKAAAEPVRDLLRSAIANAEQTHSAEAADLYVKEATVDGGPIMYRYLPRSMGRANKLRKRTCHVQLVLTDEPVAKKKGK